MLDLCVLSGPSGLPLRQRGFQVEARYRVKLSITAMLRLDAGESFVTFLQGAIRDPDGNENGHYFSVV